MIIGMKGLGRRRRWLIPVLVLTAAVLIMQSPGCEAGTEAERVEAIDDAFRLGSSKLAGLTAFIYPLGGFDFENAAFLDEVSNGLRVSRSASEEVRISLEEMRGFDYPDELEQLGVYIEEYTAAMEEALQELEGVYAGLEAIMAAIEPALEEESVLTQLEAPQSTEEWLTRLRDLYAALGATLGNLQAIEVPSTLLEYEAYMLELFGVMHKLTGDLIAAASGAAPNVEVEYNPDFLRIQELLAAYPAQVDSIYEGLGITRIDPYVEAVELEINRLYLRE